MMVESERGLDPEPFHDGKAHAVSEAPVLVTVGLEDGPAATDVAWRDPFEPCEFFFKEVLSDTGGTLSLPTSTEEREHFVDDVVRRYKKLLISSEELLGFGMIRVSGYRFCIPCTGVDENHDPLP